VRLLVIVLALAACNEEALDATVKAQCKDVLKHIVQISPQGAGTDAEQVVAALPIEDFQGCGAAEPEVRACMLVAPDIAGLKKCFPSDEILGCMHTTAKAKKAAHEQAKKGAVVDDKPFDDIRAKCWAGDAKAADSLTKS
jgi:hypothetical protein